MNPCQHVLIFSIRLYRWTVSPAKTFLFGPAGACRFTPSCSQYAMEAIQVHGAARGSWLALKRICRCHPWGGCGEDPVQGRRPSPHPSPIRWERGNTLTRWKILASVLATNTSTNSPSPVGRERAGVRGSRFPEAKRRGEI